ncbi:MAG TPA: hypothetical protein VF159_13065 [Gemmatimonadaceae bacterium]|nr:hypothetical protein [Vicinamibacterales bacterium]
MKWKSLPYMVLVPMVLAVAVAGCEAEKSANPLSPTVAGPIPGVNITAPTLIQPSQGFKYKDSEQPIKLVVQNATSNGVRPLYYTFEVATDKSFSKKLFSRTHVAPGANGRTSVQIDRLDDGRTYYWRARAEDGANTGGFQTQSFDIYPPPKLDPPRAIAPVNNQLTSNRSPILKLRASSREGPIGKVKYEIQVSTNQGFTVLVTKATVAETGSQTNYTATSLPEGETLYWRARATDGDTTSDWMATESFRTPGGGGGSPSPSPGPAPGGPCNSSDPETIVKCERAKYGHMSESQVVSFLTSTAKSLNRNGISGAPFGLLVKTGGSNCNGYSCDIICAGNGSSQKQWDVLRDAEGDQDPVWNRLSTIAIRTCQIK